MQKKLTAKLSIDINTSPAKVWHALTDPAQIKQYLFGTNTKSDWEKGSPITWTGEWQGKTYVDKGIIKHIEPGKLLHTTYFSGLSGKEDKPENYANVIYELHQSGNHTRLVMSQDNIENEEGLEHSKQNWTMVLEGLKKLVEKK